MPPTADPIFAQTCVYDWRTGKNYPCTPRWFNLSCLNAIIEDNAPPPKRWLRFLQDLWGDDQASKDLLHEFLGLCLTLITSFQKMLMLIGEQRSGKGTIIRVLTDILGGGNVANPTADQLARDFGLQPLIGKAVAIIPDARFSGREIQTTIERLLSISGEDRISINRKNKEHIAVKLSTRIIVATNSMPVLPDSSSAVANRFLVLKLQNSFLGKEDRNLEADLLREKDGILRLMLEGLRRLHQQDGFTKTPYQESFIQDLVGLGSPIRAFVRDCCIFGADKFVTTDDLYHAWKEWRDDKSEHDHLGDRQKFGRDLTLAFPSVKRKQKWIDSSKQYCYIGIGLRNTTGWGDGDVEVEGGNDV
jgi:putative DNA primase/helicase